MDQPTLLLLISKAPPLNLDLIRIARELTLPDGTLDLEAAVARTDEMDQAQTQARTHMSAAAQLAERIRWNIQLQPLPD